MCVRMVASLHDIRAPALEAALTEKKKPHR
jgi:hypothetical protein